MALKTALAEPISRISVCSIKLARSAVNFALVAQLSEDDIEIFDEQDQPLPACPAEVHERCERVCRLPLAVRLVLRQGIGPVSPSRIPGGAGEVM